MKRRYIAIFFFLFFSFPSSVFANRLFSIDGDVKIQTNGDMEIHQQWTMDIDQGTEVYIPMTQLHHMSLENFHVKDETGREYAYVSSWNVHATREQKAFKCGINQGNQGPELCFGVSGQGHKVYDIYYTFKNATLGYPDMDGYNIRFVNDQMNPLPEKVRITFELPGKILSEENTKIWGFGYRGKIVFHQGKVVAETEEGFNPATHMTVMMGLKKGMLQPETKGNGTFEGLQHTALQGSDNEQKVGNTITKQLGSSQNTNMVERIFHVFDIVKSAVFVLGIALFLLFKLKTHRVLGGRIPRNYEEVDVPEDYYNRDVPFESYLVPTYFLMNLEDELDSQMLLSAYLLKWTYEGNLEIYEDEQLKNFMFFKWKKSNIAFHLLNTPQVKPGFESSLWKFLVGATGNDEILEEGEFEQYMKKHYSYFSNIVNQLGKSWEEYAFEKNLIREEEGRFSKQVFLTSEGKDAFHNTVGFFQYLQDYTLLKERGVKEISLWDEYLIFATLFGIGEEVLKEMKDIAPDYDLIRENSSHGRNYNTFTIYKMVNNISSSAYTSYSKAVNHSGRGGSSSFGGGGGFSGGGSGGGVR